MPTYDYRCRRCDGAFEVYQAIRAPDPRCPYCGGAARRVILTAPAVHDTAALGREAAMRSLPECGKGCRCCPPKSVETGGAHAGRSQAGGRS